MDPSQWPSLSEWDPEFKKAFEANPISIPPMTSAQQIAPMRHRMNAVMQSGLAIANDLSGTRYYALPIPFRDGTELASLVFEPKTPAPPGAGRPLVVLFHGGGWTVGCAEMEAGAAASLVREFGAVVLCVEYRLAPEHDFPGPVEDGWDCLKWCVANTEVLGVDLELGFVVGGSSAGGNISAVLQHWAREEGLRPAVTGVWLGYPVTVAPDALPEEFGGVYTSYEQNSEGPVLTRESMVKNRDFYRADPHDERFSPLLWSSGHAGLTRTCIQVCGKDPLRDDGLLYEQELRKAGVETRLDVYPGVPHGFDMMFKELEVTKEYSRDRVEGFRWLLRK